MKIDVDKLHTLWYENSDGEKWIPGDGPPGDEPEGFIYQHSQFPGVLSHNCLKITQENEVRGCSHPEEYVISTYGWVDGIVGRRCRECWGTQTKEEDAEWPDEWCHDGSREIFTGRSSWSSDIVLAMTRPSMKERIVSLCRGHWNKVYALEQAIIIAANSCERCINSLGYQYGLKWGYPEYSEEWGKANTVCDFCRA
ncbi:MAG: hypothetical protein ACXADB_03825 [Candidatus Hermodarchaeia archaeon]|jgi:hypothetical protein